MLKLQLNLLILGGKKAEDSRISSFINIAAGRKFGVIIATAHVPPFGNLVAQMAIQRKTGFAAHRHLPIADQRLGGPFKAFVTVIAQRFPLKGQVSGSDAGFIANLIIGAIHAGEAQFQGAAFAEIKEIF